MWGVKNIKAPPPAEYIPNNDETVKTILLHHVATPPHLQKQLLGKETAITSQNKNFPFQCLQMILLNDARASGVNVLIVSAPSTAPTTLSLQYPRKVPQTFRT